MTIEARILDENALVEIPRQAIALSLIVLKYGHVLEPHVARNLARRVGETLYTLGGHGAMMLASYMIRAMWETGRYFPKKDNPEEDFHPREIDFVWDGIGEWRA